MLRIGKPLIVVAAILAACFASAQESFDAKYSKMELLQAKPIQHEINLTEAQRAAMNKFADKHRARVKALSDSVRAANPKATQISAADQQKLLGFYGDLRRDVFSQLTPAQLKRLRELTFQQAGPSPLMDAEIGHRVGLSDAQITKIRNIFKSGAEKASALEKKTLQPILDSYKGVKAKDQKDADRIRKEVNGKVAAAGKRIQPRIEALRVTTRNGMLAVLTPAQKKAWDALQGRKFNFGK